MVNRVDQLVDVGDYDGEGEEGDEFKGSVSYQQIREAFRNENRGHLSLVQRTNMKTWVFPTFYPARVIATPSSLNATHHNCNATDIVYRCRPF